MPHRVAPAAMPKHHRRKSNKRIMQAMAPPLRAARIGNRLETLRQLAHLFGIEHDSEEAFLPKRASYPQFLETSNSGVKVSDPDSPIPSPPYKISALELLMSHSRRIS